ncbi:MAG: OadG family protein [Anaerolineales bacterium]
MTVIENFNQGLIITGLGMGLVFLTLIVIMALIFFLDRLFRPSEEETQEEASRVTALEEMAPDSRSAGQEIVLDLADEAAAIAVALALGEAQGKRPQEGEELDPDVIMVSDITVDSGAWRARGRLTAVR